MIPHDRVVTVEGRPAAIIDRGSGPPVVLLHGGGFDRGGLSWGTVIPILAQRRRVICPDLPGYGATPMIPEGRYDIPRLGAWVEGLLDATGVEAADIAGISMGGGAALWLALERPDRVRRLVPVCAYGLAAKAPLHPLSYVAAHLSPRRRIYRAIGRRPWIARRSVGAIFADRSRVDAALVREIMAVATEQSERQSFHAFVDAEITPQGLKTCLIDEVHRIAAPTLLIHGRADPLVPFAAAEAAAARIPGARLVPLDAGHWPMREVPEAFNPAFLGFLDAIDGAGAQA